MKVRTHADIVELEKVPVAERIRHTGVADLLAHAARENAGRVALRYLFGTGPDDAARDVTFDELQRRVIQTANMLHAHDVGLQDTVTLLMPSVPETFFALWGAEIAAIANPVNYFLEASQIAGIMKEAGAKALVAVDASIYPDIWPKVEAIRAVLPDLKVFRVGGSAVPPGVIDFDEACANQPGDRLVAPKPIDGNTVAALFHTGGTTGLPKLAKHTHGALALMAWTNTLVFDLGPGTVLLNPLPQFHVGGSLFGALAPITNGWTVVIPTPLGARNPNVVRDYWSIVERNRVTVARRRADDAGRDHERSARRARPPLAEGFRDGRLDRARRAHPAHRARDRRAGHRRLRHDRGALLLDDESRAWRAARRVGRSSLALYRGPHCRRRVGRYHPGRLPDRRDRSCPDARPAGHARLSRPAP